MHLFGLAAIAASCLGPVRATLPVLSTPQNASSWPDTPFTSNGSRIQSASGRDIVYAGLNWPGAADTMLPEGLQYRSISDIVGVVAGLGMNVIRLTYAIEMIDDYLDNSPNQTLANTLSNALGSQNGSVILQQIIANNPQFTANTTRLEVFDAVAAECAKQQIWLHLDNHVSKAEWCCKDDDGNAWFGDEDFPVSNWQRGLGFLAHHAQNWTALASMSLRNELRMANDTGNNAQPYDWPHWYANMVPAAQTIYGNNTLPLIFLSGLDFDTDDTTIIHGNISATQSFNVSNITGGFGNKLAFELHYYNGNVSCENMTDTLIDVAYGAMNVSNSSYANHAPVVMTEFGFNQTDGSNEGVYAQCLKNFLPNVVPNGPGGWMQWDISGSYYIRTGVQDDDEQFGMSLGMECADDLSANVNKGMLNHNWTAYRNQTVIDDWLKPLVNATLGGG